MIENESDLNHLPHGFSILGGGSNTIIDPSILYPLVKVSPDYCETTIDGNIITCSAGQTVAKLLKWMTNNQRGGIEFAAGVPATLGGMVAMNFGCWGSEISTVVDSVQVYSIKDQKVKWVMRNDYQVSYRWSSFQETHDIILAVRLKSNAISVDDSKKLILENINYRKETQPLYKATFGSVFKNPEHQKKAWELIEDTQLKGHKIGGVEISKQHANFFENQSSATFSDTIELIQFIKKEIYNKHSVKLECEVKIVQ